MGSEQTPKTIAEVTSSSNCDLANIRPNLSVYELWSNEKLNRFLLNLGRFVKADVSVRYLIVLLSEDADCFLS